MLRIASCTQQIRGDEDYSCFLLAMITAIETPHYSYDEYIQSESVVKKARRRGLSELYPQMPSFQVT